MTVSDSGATDALTLEMMRSLSSIFKNSTGFLPPALRMVNTAFLKCVPSQHFWTRFVLVVSIRFVKEMSLTLTLPDPPPDDRWVVPVWVNAQLQPRTEIDFACLLPALSRLSPSKSSIFKKISFAIAPSPFAYMCGLTEPPNEITNRGSL